MGFSAALVPALAAGLIASPAPAEPPRVVADITLVHALLAEVMAGVAEPDLLLDQTTSPHAVQLRPSQARMLSNADLLIWVGPALSPWLERIVETRGGDQIVLMAHPATRLRDFVGADTAGLEGQGRDDRAGRSDRADDPGQTGDAKGAAADEAQGAGAGDGQDHSGDLRTGQDPHVWLSTDNARAWLGVFAEALAARVPGNAETYRDNAAAAQAGLDALAAGIAARLAPHRGAEIVTFHDSFGYFADQFGIVVAGSVRAGDAAAPSAAAVAELRDLVADRGIVCGFAEPGFDPGLLDAVAGGTGLRIGTLDPTGALQPAGPGHYAATLTAVAEGIADCLERE